MLQPTRLISTPFAQEGEKTEIQNVTGEFDNSATYRLGFPPITMQSIRSGGKPPKGTDFNGVLFDITENISFLCKGGRYQYNSGLSTLIGGYPEGSNLLLDDNVTEVVSTVNGNAVNPNSDMTGWAYSSLTPSNNLSDVADKATARTNLEVYSKTETNSIAGTPDATETIAGKAKIATTAIAQAGTNDTDFITAKKLRDALNASGVLPIYALRSWGIVEGTATPARLVEGGNIASVVDEGVGQYKITFATPMPDLNYGVLFGSTTYTLTDAGTYGTMKIGTKTVNGFIISCGQQNYVDVPEVSFGVIY